MGRDVAANPVLNRLDQQLLVERLFEELDGSQFHDTDHRCQIAIAGDKDHRNHPRARSQPSQRFDAAQFRHPQVENNAAGSSDIELFDEPEGNE